MAGPSFSISSFLILMTMMAMTAHGQHDGPLDVGPPPQPPHIDVGPAHIDTGHTPIINVGPPDTGADVGPPDSGSSSDSIPSSGSVTAADLYAGNYLTQQIQNQVWQSLNSYGIYNRPSTTYYRPTTTYYRPTSYYHTKGKPNYYYSRPTYYYKRPVTYSRPYYRG